MKKSRLLGAVCAVLYTFICMPANAELQVHLPLSTGDEADTDLDGVGDSTDNCINVANTTQIDTDSDGHGNICDGDFDNDCNVAYLDLSIFKNGFFGSDPELDLDSDGVVAFLDLAIFKGLFFGTPGPSAAGGCDVQTLIWDQDSWDNATWE